MRRRLLTAFGVLLLLGACGGPAPADAPTLDLDAVRDVFREGDVEASRQLANRVATSHPAPVAWLLEGLSDPDRNVREWSAHILGDVAPQQEDAVRALMRAFEDEDDWVRWKAARALGSIGPLAAPALPLLEKAAADVREEVVHAAAQRAVQQIRGNR